MLELEPAELTDLAERTLAHERELHIRTGGAQGAEERQGHHDIAQPVRQADVEPGAAGKVRPSPESLFRLEQVAA